MSGMSLFTLCENFELKMAFDQLDSLKTMSLLSIATAPPRSTLDDPLNLKHTHSWLQTSTLLAVSITSEVGPLFHRPPAYHDVCHSDSPAPSARVLRHLRKISTLDAQNIDFCVPSSLCGVCVTGSLLVKVDQRILHRYVNCY